MIYQNSHLIPVQLSCYCLLNNSAYYLHYQYINIHHTCMVISSVTVLLLASTGLEMTSKSEQRLKSQRHSRDGRVSCNPIQVHVFSNTFIHLTNL